MTSSRTAIGLTLALLALVPGASGAATTPPPPKPQTDQQLGFADTNVLRDVSAGRRALWLSSTLFACVDAVVTDRSYGTRVCAGENLTEQTLRPTG